MANSKITGDAIRYILANSAGVTALVGDRIYPTFTPQGINYPSIIFRVVDQDLRRTKDGIHGSRDSVLIEIYHDKAKATATIADAVVTALEGYRGTAASVVVDKINWVGNTDEVLIPELVIYHLTQQFEVRVKY